MIKLPRIKNTEVVKMDKLLTSKETAKVLGISSRTLDVWRSIGRSHVPFIKVGRSVRYRMSDIENYIQQQTMTQTTSKDDFIYNHRGLLSG